MTLAAVYNNLTTEQLKGMLGAARIDHRREMEEIKAKHATQVAAYRQGLLDTEKKWTEVLQKKGKRQRRIAPGIAQHSGRTRARPCSGC